MFDFCLLKSGRLVNVGFCCGIEDFNIFKVSFVMNYNNEFRFLYIVESG